MKKIIYLACTLSLLLIGCSNEDQAETLTVGMECDYAPFNWTTTKSNASKHAIAINSDTAYCDGYDVAIAKQLATELELELEVKKIAWDGLIPALTSGEIDVIIAGMSPTEKRKETIAFTNAYFEENPNLGIVVRADSAYKTATTLEDFDGAKITAQLGTFHIEMLSQIPNNQDTTNLESFNTLMQATISSAIDGYISEESVGIQQVSENNELVFITFEESESFILSEDQTTTAIGISKDNSELLDSLNEALATITNEERQTLMDEALNGFE